MNINNNTVGYGNYFAFDVSGSIIAVTRNNKPSAIARGMSINQTSLPKYLNYLINIGILEKKDGYHLTDPVFESWVKRNFVTSSV